VALENYRAPTELESAFLRVVTQGFPELESQIESCEVTDYDPTGWCYVHVTCGPPSPTANPVDGPTLKTGDPNNPFVETILWTNDAGMLKSVEVVEYGRGPSPDNPYELFVEAAKSRRLDYRLKG
jgi:hypothetical protein